MPDRTIEDRLREEYFDLLPEIRRVLSQLEAEIRYLTLPILRRLKAYEQLVVKSRVKDCESALRKIVLETEKQEEERTSIGEGRRFDPQRPTDYSMLNLPDLAGVRVLAFPNSILDEVNDLLLARFHDWTSKPVRADSGAILAPKYFGYCHDASGRIRGEYQVVPMLLGLFWEVEHSAMYKFSAVADSKEMRDLRTKVEEALSNFETGIEKFVRASPNRLQNIPFRSGA